MSFSSAVDWWEEWQLRILVLGSLLVQYLLFLSAPLRKSAIPAWFRSLIWLSYLGSDALAIYALATLFTRQRKQFYCSSAQGNSILEVVWAPVLLMHLGGQDFITAYNIEDNELWRRHVLTSVSQVTVAIYVFCKSWPGSDDRLLAAAILFFIPGILKCLEKPWALKSASINSLVCSSGPSPRMSSRVREVNSLDEYVQATRDFIQAYHQRQAHGEGDAVADLEANHRHQQEGGEVDLEPYKLFVDLASPYPDRLGILKSFWVLDDTQAYVALQKGLFFTFDLLYTKIKMASLARLRAKADIGTLELLSCFLRVVAAYLPLAAIGLFHHSRRETYNHNDVKVTYVLFCCTPMLEYFTLWLKDFKPRLSGMVAQYSFIGFFARNEKHTKKMSIVSFFKSKDFLDQHWCMKSCSSSPRITKLVLRHVKGWWMEHILDVASYRRFNNYRGQWTIQHTGCDQDLGWSLNMPFDESVLLWHIATDLCFYYTGTSLDHRCATTQCEETCDDDRATWCKRSPHHGSATGCREMSHYMVYLLFVNPEMLVSGTRRDLFMTANAKLEEILKDGKPSPKEIHKGEKQTPEEIERGIVQRIIAKVQPTECREEVVGCRVSPPNAEKYTTKQESVIHDAWKLSKALLALSDEKKMWEVIEGVWVEMLCFSASRCRGYLHAKSLGSGVELLTYIWLLLYQMGMETLPERMQRTELSSGGNAGESPSTSQVSTSTGEVTI